MFGLRHAVSGTLIGVLALGCACIAGCGQKVTEGVPETQRGIQQLMAAANRYRQSHRGQLPPNEAEFKKFIDGLKQSELDELGIKDKDKVFISPRDNQPYVIRYGAKDPTMPSPSDMKKGAGASGTSSMPVFAYEKNGSGGKRWVVLTQGGSAIEMDEEAFKKAVPDAQ